MRNSRKILALALLSAFPLAVLASGKEEGRGAKTITVGEFAVMLSAVTSGAPAADAKAAAAILARAGVPLGDPNATLRERQLADVLGHYGLPVTSSAPGQPVTLAKAETAVALVSGRNAVYGVEQDSQRECPADQFQNLQGCLLLAKRGHCIRCCKELCGPRTGCPTFCRDVERPSASAP